MPPNWPGNGEHDSPLKCYFQTNPLNPCIFQLRTFPDFRLETGGTCGLNFCQTDQELAQWSGPYCMEAGKGMAEKSRVSST